MRRKHSASRQGLHDNGERGRERQRPKPDVPNAQQQKREKNVNRNRRQANQHGRARIGESEKRRIQHTVRGKAHQPGRIATQRQAGLRGILRIEMPTLVDHPDQRHPEHDENQRRRNGQQENRAQRASQCLRNSSKLWAAALRAMLGSNADAIATPNNEKLTALNLMGQIAMGQFAGSAAGCQPANCRRDHHSRPQTDPYSAR